ncbi:MAG: hypothetical protein U9Q77_05195 [Candidatus Marinimicrobia bacterium]|nr:hypothetical protein [Candidatus Neomarinimicrobiota bacterium]
MREFGIVLSLISIAIGVLLLIAPKVLIKLSEQTNRLYNIDGLVYRNRYLLGSMLLFASAFLIYTTF